MTQIFIYGVLIFVILVLIMAVLYYRHCLKRERNQYNQFVFKVNQKDDEIKKTRKRRYITSKMKSQVFERDDCTCQICGISKSYLDSFVPGLGDYLLLEIDHIESVYNGGNGSDGNNLQVLCWRCNRKKGKNKTNEQVKEIIDYGVKFLNER